MTKLTAEEQERVHDERVRRRVEGARARATQSVRVQLPELLELAAREIRELRDREAARVQIEEATSGDAALPQYEPLPPGSAA